MTKISETELNLPGIYDPVRELWLNVIYRAILDFCEPTHCSPAQVASARNFLFCDRSELLTFLCDHLFDSSTCAREALRKHALNLSKQDKKARARLSRTRFESRNQHTKKNIDSAGIG